MKTNIIFLKLCLFLTLFGCITEYETTGIEEVEGILVVEGIITDEESIIKLSRSINLTDVDYYNPVYVDNASVYVECEDGTQWDGVNLSGGQYALKTGQLDLERKYRLKIEIEEVDGDCYFNSPLGGNIACPTKIYEYSSDFSYPIQTPEIDSVFWIKRTTGQPVNIHVATHSSDNQVLYYRWSYKEDWEINSVYGMEPTYPYYCWNMYNSREILLGSDEKTVFGQLMDKILEISPSDRKFSVLYRIVVRQNAISKRAYDYFTNIKKNNENMGSIFAPVPSELRGNIICTTDPTRSVIGYIDISSTTQKTMYISKNDVYERPWSCPVVVFEGDVPSDYVRYGDEGFVHVSCVDCTYHGTTHKPEDWPNNH